MDLDHWLGIYVDRVMLGRAAGSGFWIIVIG